jgi:hypothetical protein
MQDARSFAIFTVLRSGTAAALSTVLVIMRGREADICIEPQVKNRNQGKPDNIYRDWKG